MPRRYRRLKSTTSVAPTQASPTDSEEFVPPSIPVHYGESSTELLPDQPDSGCGQRYVAIEVRSRLRHDDNIQSGERAELIRRVDLDTYTVRDVINQFLITHPISNTYDAWCVLRLETQTGLLLHPKTALSDADLESTGYRLQLCLQTPCPSNSDVSSSIFCCFFHRKRSATLDVDDMFVSPETVFRQRSIDWACMGNCIVTYLRAAFILGLGLAFVLLFYATILWMKSNNMLPPPVDFNPFYAGMTSIGPASLTSHMVIFDAGSMHTTVEVYKLDDSGAVRQTASCEISHAADLEDNIPALDSTSLFNSTCFSSTVVPAVGGLERCDTVAFLGATGGMRIAELEEPEQVSELVSSLSSNMSRKFDCNASQHLSKAEILSGRDEGVFAWHSVTNLTNNLHSGLLDWGGASAQLVVPMMNSSLSDLDFDDDNIVISLNQTLYAVSHLCYGQSVAIKRMLASALLKNFIASSSGSELDLTIRTPCFPSTTNFSLSKIFTSTSDPCMQFMDSEFQTLVSDLLSNSVNITVVGDPDVEDCQSDIQHALFNNTACISNFGPHCMDTDLVQDRLARSRSNSFIALSTYYYVVQALGKFDSRLVNRGVEAIDFDLIRDATSIVCSDANAVDLCIQSVYMLTLLQDGYGLTSQNISAVNKIDGISLSWTAGYVMVHIADSVTNENDTIWDFGPRTIFLIIVLAIAVVILAIIYYRLSRPRPEFADLMTRRHIVRS